jgi:hypothetical protein
MGPFPTPEGNPAIHQHNLKPDPEQLIDHQHTHGQADETEKERVNQGKGSRDRALSLSHISSLSLLLFSPLAHSARMNVHVCMPVRVVYECVLASMHACVCLYYCKKE